jgi:hypothetical protein
LRFLAIALIVFVGATEARADPQFSDSDLLDGNWSSQVFILRIGSGGVGHVSTGGNPGGFRRIAIDVGSATEPLMSQVVLADFRASAIVDPSQDAVVTVDYTEDFRCLSSLGCVNLGQAHGPALEQDGMVYINNAQVTHIAEAWDSLAITGLTAESFVRVQPDGQVSGSEHPDFSISGSPIQFGYFRRMSAAGGGLQFATEADIDNWLVTVHTGLPVPAMTPGASAVLVSLLLALGVVFSRRAADSPRKLQRVL